MLTLATLLISACGGGAVASPVASEAVASASPTAVPTATPTDSPGQRALAVLADPTAQLRATIEGTLNQATTEGTYEQSGRDFHLVLVTTLGGMSFTTEQTIARDQTYLLTLGGPWHHDPVVSGANRAPTLSEALESVSVGAAGGTTPIGGITAESYQLDGVRVADVAASLGLADPGAKMTGQGSTFFVSPDGKPAALDLTFTVPASGGTPYDAHYRLIFESSSAPIAIAAPADAWVDKADGHGYDMSYPASWEAELDPSTGDFTDTFIGPDARVIVFCRPNAKLDLEDWIADGDAFYTERFGGKPDFASEVMVGDIPARALAWEQGTVEGVPQAIINVGLVQGPTGCDIQLFRDPGPTGDLDDMFATLLTTFSLD